MGIFSSKPKPKEVYKVLIIVKKDDRYRIVDTLEIEEEKILKLINEHKNLPKDKDGHHFPKKYYL